jgi:chromate transporter
MLRPAVIAMILVSGILIVAQVLFPGNNYTVINIDIKVLVLFIIASVLMKCSKINPIYIMIVIGIANIIISL